MTMSLADAGSDRIRMPDGLLDGGNTLLRAYQVDLTTYLVGSLTLIKLFCAIYFLWDELLSFLRRS